MQQVVHFTAAQVDVLPEVPSGECISSTAFTGSFFAHFETTAAMSSVAPRVGIVAMRME